jgi:nitrilase
MDEIARGKYDFDVTGHYARPDVFRLHVNEAPAPAVTFRHASPGADSLNVPDAADAATHGDARE